MFDLSVLGLKVLIFSYITAKRQLIHNRSAQKNAWNQNYEFIVVGAGTAGCTVAHRLTEDPRVTVLLLEAGGAQDAIFNDMPGLWNRNITQNRPDLEWPYYNEPSINFGRQFPGARSPERTGKAIGGSSSHSAMLFTRGNRKDYDSWADNYGAKGWNYKNVLPYFKKYENNTDWKIVANNPEYHGTDGPVQISSPRRPPKFFNLLMKSLNEFGIERTDINGPKQSGAMIMQQTIQTNGFRASNGNAYVDPNPHPNNLHIVTRAMVSKILFHNLTAVGVEFVRNDVLYRVYSRKEVILTAGSIRTPQILMLSGIGFKSHLDKFNIFTLLDLPVGNNLMDRPLIYLGPIAIKNPDYFYPTTNLDIKSLSELYFKRSGRLSEYPYLNYYFSTKNNIPKDWPNIFVFTFIENNLLGVYPNLMRVRSRGTLRLQSSSPYIPPKIDPKYLSDWRDFEDIVDGVKYMLYFLEKSSIAQYLKIDSFDSIGCPVCANKFLFECLERIECIVRYSSYSSNHACGTCRMGAISRDDVVVDPYLRVKNTKNLRICDASIFPELPNANINAATNMVAEKCSQMIKDYFDLNYITI